MNVELPDEVRRIADAVSEKLGRPAHCRKVKNRDKWFIYDPVFFYIQQGMKKGGTGYRVGYNYDVTNRCLWFTLVHSPIMADLFKRNLAMATLIEVLRATSRMREWHTLIWSSKIIAYRSGGKKHTARSSNNSYIEFLEDIQPLDDDFDLIKDLFPRTKNTGKGEGDAPVAGNTFFLKLADRHSCFESMESIKKLINLTWPLFLCLYPIKPIERRTAALARKMLARQIPRVCEFAQIDRSVEPGISPLCRGKVQGAHIKPDAHGGSDLPENGIWLCEYHHRLTEGKIAGKRDDGVLSVRYIARN